MTAFKILEIIYGSFHFSLLNTMHSINCFLPIISTNKWVPAFPQSNSIHTSNTSCGTNQHSSPVYPSTLQKETLGSCTIRTFSASPYPDIHFHSKAQSLLQHTTNNIHQLVCLSGRCSLPPDHTDARTAISTHYSRPIVLQEPNDCTCGVDSEE